MSAKRKAHEFQVGDRVRLMPPRKKKWAHWKGVEATVLSPLEKRYDGAYRHKLDVDTSADKCQPYAEPKYLRPA